MGLITDVEVVADSDTRWKWGATLAPRLAQACAAVPLAAIPPAMPRVRASLLAGHSSPTEGQLRDVGIAPHSLHRRNVAATVAELASTDAQLVVLACGGGTVQALLHALARVWAGRRERPIVVTGYVGLVYENLVDGLLCRAGADLVLANSAHDADRFRAIYAAAGADPDTVVQTALPYLGGVAHDPGAAGRDRPFTVTFVTQPGVPATKAERRYALEQAVQHAATHRKRRVLVKLRARVGERTTHVEPYHYESLLPARRLPRNLEFSYGPMSPVLDQTDLCVTVSSTAAIEAMHRGIPTGILLDFGLREALGNQLFLGSGVLTTWAALHEGALPMPEPNWAARCGIDDPDPYAAAACRIDTLLATPEPLAPLQPWLGTVGAAAYLPALLARHGLDASGTPLSSGTARTGWPSRAMRTAARRAYGVGVRIVEPRVRRLAQL